MFGDPDQTGFSYAEGGAGAGAGSGACAGSTPEDTFDTLFAGGGAIAGREGSGGGAISPLEGSAGGAMAPPERGGEGATIFLPAQNNKSKS